MILDISSAVTRCISLIYSIALALGSFYAIQGPLVNYGPNNDPWDKFNPAKAFVLCLCFSKHILIGDFES